MGDEREPAEVPCVLGVPTRVRCPRCGGPGITLLRKLSLGPALPATCASCGGKVGVPWRVLLFPVLPFTLLTSAIPLVARAARPYLQNPMLLIDPRVATYVTLFGLSWLTLAWYWVAKVPLEPR
ncbi:MAG: hypothetical protein AB7N76_35145 [Planctomycetota bacterium]